MDTVYSLFNGFALVFHPSNLFFCFLGTLIGTLVGVLPGLGPAAALSLLLFTTTSIPPVSGIIMLAGIYYGAMYGGSTTSILLNIPGEAASVVTCIDGYQMARKGRAGPALGISAFGSFIAGTGAVVGLMVVAPPLAEMALKFGPPEYFSLIVAGLTLVTFLARGKMWKALLMATFGLILGSIGTDSMMGATRFTLGIPELIDGIGLVPVVMGFFGLSEVLLNIEKPMGRSIFETKIQNLLPTLNDWAHSTYAILRGTLVGFFLGVIPGGSPILASFVSYAAEKKISKNPELFGTGMIAGVAGPESANNSACTGAFIPMLTLGIPSTSTMAILFGALMMNGMQPGPLFIKEHPDMFWGLIASMYLGNMMLLALNLPLIGLWVRILRVPYPILFPLIIVFCLVGSYSLNYSLTEVFIMIMCGWIGYILRKFEYDLAPFVLAMVLGPQLETSMRQALLLRAGDPTIFITQPISAFFLAVALLILVMPFIPKLKKKFQKIPKEEAG
ncbi:MAG: transporter [Deltaproteobacteria bacterium RBG_13_51_10]|nr:MAG: transporter [Deltaproteobacteria bacterium RBG_13_51_10]